MLPFGVSDDVVRTRIPSFGETPHRLDDDVIEEFEGAPMSGPNGEFAIVAPLVTLDRLVPSALEIGE
jgi:hypothetical protein